MDKFANSMPDIAMSIFSIYAAIAIWLIVFVILTYVVTSYAYYRILKFAQYEHPGYAFIPVYNRYAIAEASCIGSKQSLVKEVFGLEMDNQSFAILSVSMAIIPLVMGALIGLITGIVSILCFATSHAGFFAMMHGTDPKEERLMGILCAVFPIIPTMIYLFSNFDKINFRNKLKTDLHNTDLTLPPLK